MKFFIIFLTSIIIFFNACSSENKNGFMMNSSDCEVIKSQCIKKAYSNNDKSRAQIMQECETARAMCEAVKTKGCLQQCNLDFKKGSQEYARCQEKCKNKN